MSRSVSERRELHRLLHDLWSKAVGQPGYDKQQWKRLERFLFPFDCGGDACGEEQSDGNVDKN